MYYLGHIILILDRQKNTSSLEWTDAHGLIVYYDD